MRIDLEDTCGCVLYDPEALRDLLALDEHPARAFIRFPRRLEREIRAGNAWLLSMDPDDPDPALLIDEPLPERWRNPDGERDEAWLRVPSGVLLKAGGDRDLERPPEPVAEVPPGLYVIRRIIEGLSEPPQDPASIPAAKEALSAADLRIVTRFTWLVVTPVLAAGVTAVFLTVRGESHGLWTDGLIYGGILGVGTVLVLVLRFLLGAHPALKRLETAEKERECLVRDAKAARARGREDQCETVRDLLVLERREDPWP